MGILDNININPLVERTKDKIKEIYLKDEMPWVIGYSGGKDSTCTTQIIIDSLLDFNEQKIPLHKKVYVISSDTMVETPMIIATIEDTIARINNLADRLNLPIEAKIIKPAISKSFWANLIGRGYPCPNQTFRWCTDRLKIEPANHFIESIIQEHGEAVMILGVREGESNSRDRVLDSHTIEGKDLMRHTTQDHSYVFAPIRLFTKDDVWNYLLTNPSPWGSDNTKLFKLYRDSLTGEECPIMMSEEDKKRTTCGNSRFGCWVCTVVQEDKSLTGFIKSGIAWLKPLLEFRNWIYSIRDDENRRMRRRLNGNIYFSDIDTDSNGNLIIAAKGNRAKNVISFFDDKWIDLNNEEWNVFTSPNSEREAQEFIIKNNVDLDSGINPKIIIKKLNDKFYQLGVGPFTLSTRKEILERLLELQHGLNNGYQLIKKDEIIEIQKLWYEKGDMDNSAYSTYRKFYNDEVDFVKDDLQLLTEDDINQLKIYCSQNDISFQLFNELLNIEKSNFGYKRRSEALKQIKTKLSQEFLRYMRKEDNNED